MTSSQLLVLLGVGVAVWVSLIALRRTAVPTAVVLVVGGAVIGFLPFVPHASLNPRLALDGILPPLIFYSAYGTSPRALADDGVRIGLLAVGLVAVTAGTVALAAHAIDGLSWPMSFVLGTAVGPTDAVAATGIASKLGLPQRLSTLLEGEAMLNDATALVLYAAAVTAATTRHFSAGGTAASMGFATVVGGAIGLGVGVVGNTLRRRIDDPPLQILLSIILAYAAYLPAQYLHASGVLAGVVAGLYLGWHQDVSLSALTRLQAKGFWDTAEFMLNAILFSLVGLSLHTFTATARGPVGRLALAAVGVVGAVVVIRLIWSAAMPVRSPITRDVESRTGRRWEQALLGWSGMRGGLTLAAVLAIPRTTSRGRPLAGRDDVTYLAFAVIFATLVGQGLTLPFLARRFRPAAGADVLDGDRGSRTEVMQAALHALDEAEGVGTMPSDVIHDVRRMYLARSDRLQQLSQPLDDAETRIGLELALRRDVITTQRHRLAELRAHGDLDATVFRAIQHDLDLDEARLSSEAAVLERSTGG